MVVEPEQRPAAAPETGIEALAEAARKLADGLTLGDSVELVVGAAARATGAEVAIGRVRDDSGDSLSAGYSSDWARKPGCSYRSRATRRRSAVSSSSAPVEHSTVASARWPKWL